MFSLAAPVAAILTFLGLGSGAVVMNDTLVAVSLCFSAGTFLYVSTAHILPDLLSQQLTTKHIAARHAFVTTRYRR